MKSNILFLMLLCSGLLQGMRPGVSFYSPAEPVAVNSQAATQLLSQDDSDIEVSYMMTQRSKDRELVIAIENDNEMRTIASFKHGASLPCAVKAAIGYDKPALLKKILRHDPLSTIFRLPIGDPVDDACRKAKASGNMELLLVLLADKRVDVCDYIKNGKANGSVSICGLFLIAAQGKLTDNDIGTASFHISTQGVGPVLLNYKKPSELYTIFPIEQHKKIHDMLLDRESDNVVHLEKAADWGHEYMVSRLLFTAPFEPVEIDKALSVAQAQGHKKIVEIIENRHRLSEILPIEQCNQFVDILVSSKQTIKLTDYLLNARAGIAPAIAQARLSLQKKRLAACKPNNLKRKADNQAENESASTKQKTNI